MTNINSIKDRIEDVLTEEVGFIEEDYLFDLLEEALGKIVDLENRVEQLELSSECEGGLIYEFKR